MIVKTVKHGNCTWNYDDEFCRDVTPEQAQEIVDSVSRIIMNALRRKEANGEKNKRNNFNHDSDGESFPASGQPAT